jgi:hypothetical protein
VAHSRCPHICEMKQCAQATTRSPRALMWGLRPSAIPTIPHLTRAEPNPESRFPTALDQPLSSVQQGYIEVYTDHSSRSLNAWTKGPERVRWQFTSCYRYHLLCEFLLEAPHNRAESHRLVTSRSFRAKSDLRTNAGSSSSSG